eukprot:m.94873 g.94873  ORF g.94873 m.94873 type:complete len:326 (-) comp13463_c0_seq1:35-1012(-)
METQTKAENIFQLKSADASNFEWESITKVWHIPGGLGSSGVFLANGPQGAVVLKPVRSSACSEVFASRIAKHIGLQAPSIRILSKDDYRAAMRSMRSSLFSPPGDKHRLQDQRLQELLLIEYVAGVPLYLSQSFKAELEKSTENFGEGYDCVILKQLGEICALDMLLNNMDRIPFAHKNEGNISNVIVGHDNTVYAIDQALMVIKNENMRAGYCAALKAALAEAQSMQPGECWGRVKKHLCENTGIKVEDHCSQPFYRGILDCHKKITTRLDVSSSTGEGSSIDIIRKKVYSEFMAVRGPGPFFKEGMACVDIDFLTHVLTSILS